MAEIFLLAERRGRKPPPSMKEPPQKAEILFFTGVRYERLETQAPAEKTRIARKGRPRRAAKR